MQPAEHPLVAAQDVGEVGRAASDPEYRSDPERTVTMLATLLGELHDTHPDPGTLVTVTAIDVAEGLRRDLERHALDAGRLDAAYVHMSLERLVDVLVGGVGALADRPVDVLTHGSPTLDHLRVDDGRALGFTSWERAALGDPVRDLAPAVRSLVAAYGPGVVPAFFARYPHPTPPVAVIDWYALADALGECRS